MTDGITESREQIDSSNRPSGYAVTPDQLELLDLRDRVCVLQAEVARLRKCRELLKQLCSIAIRSYLYGMPETYPVVMSRELFAKAKEAIGNE